MIDHHRLPRGAVADGERQPLLWYLKGVLRKDLVIFRSRPGYGIQADWILERRFLPAETLPSQGECNMIHPCITNIHQSSSIQLAYYDLVRVARLFLVIIPITR